MRQGQQSRRGRGRGRKVQNPLSRNYESNGPDVKIRGTAAHIAEKYSTLARDALASGDTVTAENFFQHAEHYNRIIMAAQTQVTPTSQPHADAVNGSGAPRGRRRPDRDDGDEADTASSDAFETVSGDESGDGDDSGPARQGRNQGRNGAEAAKETASANGSGGDMDVEANTSSEDGPPDSAIA